MKDLFYKSNLTVKDLGFPTEMTKEQVEKFIDMLYDRADERVKRANGISKGMLSDINDAIEKLEHYK